MTIYINGVDIPPLDDVPVDAEVRRGITSNWSYDHAADIIAHMKGGTTDVVRTGEYTVFQPDRTHGATTVIAADTLYAIPYIVPRDITVDRIAVHVQVADVGKFIRLGIYNTGANLYPGSLLLDAATISVGTGGIKAININQALTKGLYWLAFVSDGTPSLGGGTSIFLILGVKSTHFGTGNIGWSVGHVFGALPDLIEIADGRNKVR